MKAVLISIQPKWCELIASGQKTVEVCKTVEVRKLLNTYCGYELAEDDILLILIDDWWYYISDIGLRMLSPRELYDAMGFPHDYVIDRDPMGNKISRADQVARCGNAVCPAVAEAMVRANLPELAARKMGSMEELRGEMCS